MDLLERELHLNVLNQLLEGLQAQVLSGQLIFISGEAGIGKTTLVRHFTQKAGETVLWGMCDPLITPRPLAPLVDILQQTHSDLFKLLQSSSDHFPVFSGFLNELKQNPDVTVVVIEDVHWADSATLDLVKYLGRRIEQTRTLLILTYRDDEVGSNHPLQAVVGDLFRLETVQRMMLPRLSPEAVVSLTANTTFQSDIIYQLTDGNPFFVTELLADNRPDQIPATIRDAVLARKSRLSLSAQSILGIAAVIGAKSEPWLLADLASAETDAIEACLSSGILQVQEGLYIFRHELSRQAILSAILPHHKQVVHRLVFDALEASEMGRKDVARLAYHAEGAGDVFKLKQYALAAAEEASAVGAFHTVREQYQRILQSGASLSRDERADLLEAYAQACLLTDHIEQAIDANQEALGIWQEIGNRQREGACLSKQANCYFVDAQPDAADRASLDAIAILESLDTTQALAAAYGVEAALRMLNRDVEDAIRWGWRAFEIAQQF